ncbi:DNA/RNA polymerase [Phellopilus nigrolimitatus]|nr:DNA/RNA polymerase [Phellopilus nigrolimitatus]
MTTLGETSSFSDLFNQDEPEFLEALRTTVFPGDIPVDSSCGRKRQHSGDREVLSKLSQEFVKKLSQASTTCGDESGNEEQTGGRKKRMKTSVEPDFVEGSSRNQEQDDIRRFDEVRSEKQSKANPLPIYSTDPTSLKDASRVPNYAPYKANEHAERLMQDAHFRTAHTSAGGSDFIDGFYKNSRLHHLSTWKVELRALVAEAQERADKEFIQGDGGEGGVGTVADDGGDGGDGLVGKVKADTGTSMRGNAFQLLRSPSKGKEKAREQDESVIMHCDFDCFFASVGILTRPYLKDQPVVVCHSQASQGESSTSEVSSANYKARDSGIKAGMSLQQARKLCPCVVTVPYEFEKYKKASLQLYTILLSYADDLQAVSVDEALIDVTTAVKNMPSSPGKRYDPAKTFAEMLRAKIKESTGCDVSIGISHNILLARLATRKAKPAGSYHLKLADLQKYIEHVCVDELHGFGRATREKALEKLGVATLGELAKKPRSVLCDALGKTTGATLYDAVRGIDNRRLESDKARKSVSAEINYGIRFENSEQAQAFMFQLAEEVARRLSEIEMRGRSLTLKIMKRDPDAPVEPPKFLGHGCCNIFNKQANLSSADGRATSDALVIGQQAWRLLKSVAFDPRELRGIGIQIQKLEKATQSSELGQLKLDFKPKKVAKEAKEAKGRPDIALTVQPASSPDFDSGPTQPTQASNLALPSFSQVDRKSFESLPVNLRHEITKEYSRRSASPALSGIGDSAPSLSPPKRKTTDKGTPLGRITQALAPRNRTGSGLSSASAAAVQKHNIFERCQVQKETRGTKVEVTRAELARLGIDARVFAELPAELQLEQLASVRFARSFKGKGSDVLKK